MSTDVLADPTTLTGPVTAETILAELRRIIDVAEAAQDGELTDDQVARYEELEGQLKRVQKTAELRSRQTAYETPIRTGTVGAVDAGSERRGVPSLLPDPARLGELRQAASSGSALRVETRAVVLSANTGASGRKTSLAARGGVAEPRRLAVAGALAVQEVGGIEAVSYPVFGAGAAGIPAEGALKQEFTTITGGSATPEIIAMWTDLTRQTTWTDETFAAKLEMALSRRVANREDLLLITKVFGTAGIQTFVDATLDADTVLLAASMIAASVAAATPNLVLCNPADVTKLVGVAVGTGGSGSPDFSEFLPMIHGLVLYPTNHVAVGQLLVGAFQTARYVVGVPPTFLVDAMSGMKSNVVTAMLEEAVTIAVDEPLAFLRVTPV